MRKYKPSTTEKFWLNAIMLPSYLCGRKKTWVTLADVELASAIIVQKLGRSTLLKFFFKMRPKGYLHNSV